MLDTPMDRSIAGSLKFGANLIESLAIDRAVHQTLAYEADLCRAGSGTPPLSETVSLGIMWHDVVRCPVGEA